MSEKKCIHILRSVQDNDFRPLIGTIKSGYILYDTYVAPPIITENSRIEQMFEIWIPYRELIFRGETYKQNNLEIEWKVRDITLQFKDEQCSS